MNLELPPTLPACSLPNERSSPLVVADLEPVSNRRSSSIYDTETSSTGDADGETTIFQEKTMVEGIDEEAEDSPAKIGVDTFHSSFRLSGVHTEEKASVSGPNPLQNYFAEKDVTEANHDVTIVGEAGDIVDASGKLLYPDANTRPVGSQRASHLRLDLKPPSPHPWDLVEPPNDHRKPGYYSPSASHNFHAMQSTTNARPLIPKSSYYFGPPPLDSAYGTAPIGQIGVHHPREIIRVERDYTGGELVQFAPIYPLELENRLTPTQFLESINSINELLISAHSLRHSFLDNVLTVFSLQLSKLFVTTHYEKEMQRVHHLIDDLNAALFNPVGLNILWPENVAFLFLEIEYY